MDYTSVKKNILERLRTELPENLFYHGVHHTVAVNDSIKIIAAYENVSDVELTLLKTAALLHDFGFIFRYEDHEILGSDEAKRILPSFGYDDQQISIICGMILATKVPQLPKNKLQKIICDADLFHLGSDQFTSTSNTLRSELICIGQTFTDQEWISFQLRFLDMHSFFTKYGQDVLSIVKNMNVEQLRLKLTS